MQGYAVIFQLFSVLLVFQGGEATQKAPEDIKARLLLLKTHYPEWGDTQPFLLVKKHLNTQHKAHSGACSQSQTLKHWSQHCHSV